LFLVVNAACMEGDYDHIGAALPKDCRLERLDDRALIALQGPAAIAVMNGLATGIANLGFMSVAGFKIAGIDCLVSRSGYTGEDGVEISVPNAQAEALAQTLLKDARVKPVGLGARDTLRLEAGLCLYGHDIDLTTTPVEAALAWSIGKRRRDEGGFAGAAVIRKQLQDGVTRKRVGILPDGRVPVRDGAEIADRAGAKLGTVTSGGFGPSVDRPIAMGYVASAHSGEGAALNISVRDKKIVSKVTRLPFVAHRYHKG
jgi:aminomethyltransferase